jgi:c-di-GMP-binding flagellar brake protein YcgR
LFLFTKKNEIFETEAIMLKNNIVHHENRQYYRHPSHIPIEVWQPDSAHHLEQLNNVSLGGIAFESDSPWEPNSIISFNVQMVNQSHQFTGKVVWCRKREHDNYFEVGVQFLENNNSQQEDLVDEVCDFEIYKRMLFGFLDEFYESQLEYIV